VAQRRALILTAKDTVANALEEVAAGEVVAARLGGETNLVTALDRIPFGFKVALEDVPLGGDVYKYGEIIGKASQPIKRGQLVHVHNLAGTRGRGDLHRGAGRSETEAGRFEAERGGSR
jgi:altronate dehydratase small subunit